MSKITREATGKSGCDLLVSQYVGISNCRTSSCQRPLRPILLPQQSTVSQIKALRAVTVAQQHSATLVQVDLSPFGGAGRPVVVQLQADSVRDLFGSYRNFYQLLVAGV